MVDEGGERARDGARSGVGGIGVGEWLHPGTVLDAAHIAPPGGVEVDDDRVAVGGGAQSGTDGHPRFTPRVR